jgi:hypothetical protein
MAHPITVTERIIESLRCGRELQEFSSANCALRGKPLEPGGSIAVDPHQYWCLHPATAEYEFSAKVCKEPLS